MRRLARPATARSLILNSDDDENSAPIRTVLPLPEPSSSMLVSTST